MNSIIIIPCYNEEKSIIGVLQEISGQSPQSTVIVIDDGSTDNTSRLVKAYGKAELLKLPINLGIGGAVQTGFKYALMKDFPVAFKLDGDGQHPPGAIQSMLDPLISDSADLVIGTRFSPANQGFKSTLMRRAGIKILQGLCYLLTGMNITDPTSGFRGYSKKAIEFMAQHYPTFDYPEPEEIVLAARNGLRIMEIPVEMRDRQSGISTISSTMSIYYMLKVTLAMIFIFLRPIEKDKK